MLLFLLKIVINQKWRKCKNLFEPLVKKCNIYIFNQFFIYCLFAIRKFSLLNKSKNRRNSLWNINIKDSFLARYCHNCTIFERVSFKQHVELQISISLWVQFSELLAKFDSFIIYNHGIFNKLWWTFLRNSGIHQ